jgi:probable F420-dependent oxidoreductase
VRVSLGLPIDRPDPTGTLTTAAGIAACSQLAERLGFDAVNVTDHPAPDERWLRTGHDTLDPFVALSFAAAATSTIKLHTNLLVLGYRNPILTAKAVASLDALSGGRTIVGVGVGYMEAEFNALGAAFDDRARRADDALTAMRKAWSGEPFDHDGIDYTARRTIVQPSTVQRPHPPIWVGGNSKAAMRRAVEHGSGWSPMPSPKKLESYLGTPGMETVEELAARVDELRAMAAAAGRTEPLDVIAVPTALTIWAKSWDPDAVVDEAKQLQAAGATALVAIVPGGDIDSYTEAVELFASQVLPKI